MILRILDLEFRVNLLPDVLHIFAIFHNSVSDGVVQLQQSLVFVNVISDEKILILTGHHDLCVLGTTDKSVHFDFRFFGASEACLDYAAAVVNHKGFGLSEERI